MIAGKKILVVQTAFLGDVILSTSFIEAVNLAFPHSKVDILVTPDTQKVLGSNPFLHKILIFDKKENKIIFFWHLLSKIRKEKYDLSFLLHSSFTSCMFAFLGGISKRVGFDRNLSRFFLTDKVQFRQDCHRIEKNFSLLSVFGVKFKLPKTKVYAKTLPALFENNYKTVAVAPGSVWQTKRLPIQKFKEILVALPRVNLLFVGSKEEWQLCEDLKNNLQDLQRVVNLAGKCQILETAEYLRQADLVLCNDSGILHLSEAVGTRVFAFFGPTVKKLGYYPYLEQDKMFEVDLECRPCGKHGHSRCPLGHHECMNNIDTTKVVIEIKKDLQI